MGLYVLPLSPNDHPTTARGSPGVVGSHPEIATLQPTHNRLKTAKYPAPVPRSLVTLVDYQVHWLTMKHCQVTHAVLNVSHTPQILGALRKSGFFPEEKFLMWVGGWVGRGHVALFSGAGKQSAASNGGVEGKHGATNRSGKATN